MFIIGIVLLGSWSLSMDGGDKEDPVVWSVWKVLADTTTCLTQYPEGVLQEQQWPFNSKEQSSELSPLGWVTALGFLDLPWHGDPENEKHSQNKAG